MDLDALTGVEADGVGILSGTRWKGMTMTMKTERQTLLDRFQQMKASEGLVDMKFHLGQVSESTTEEVCGQVNKLLDAYADGQVRLFDKWGDARIAA